MTVCAVTVANGDLEIFDAEHNFLTFEQSQIAEFRHALDEAIVLAEEDLRLRRAEAQVKARARQASQ
jgi:hypothetical protein